MTSDGKSDAKTEYRDLEIPFARHLRRGFWIVLALVVLLAAGVVALRVWGARRLQAVRAEATRQLGSTDLADYAMPPVEPGDDVAARLEAVAEMLAPHLDELVRLHDLDDRPASQWSDEERRQVRNLLVANAAALVRARGVVALPAADFGVDVTAVGGGSSQLLPQLQVSKLLRLHAALAVYDGERELAAGSIAALGHVADAYYAHPQLLLQMLGAVNEERQLRSLRELLAAAPLDEDLLADPALQLCQGGTAEDARRTVAYGVASVLHAAKELPRRNDARGDDDRGDEVGWQGTVVRFLVGDLWLAESIRPLIAAGDVGRVPYAELTARIETAAQSDLPFLADRILPLIETRAALFRLRAVAAARHQARLALAAAGTAAEDGAYPATLPDAASPAPLLFTPSTYTHRPDGSALIDHPALRELIAKERPRDADPLIVWPLPALSAKDDPN